MKYEWKTSAKLGVVFVMMSKQRKKNFGAGVWGECKNTQLRTVQRCVGSREKHSAINFLKQSELFDAFHRLNYAWDALQSEINSETLCNAAKHHLSCHFTVAADDVAGKTPVRELLLRTIRENYRSFVLSYFSVIQQDYSAVAAGPDYCGWVEVVEFAKFSRTSQVLAFLLIGRFHCSLESTNWKFSVYPPFNVPRHVLFNLTNCAMSRRNCWALTCVWLKGIIDFASEKWF